MKSLKDTVAFPLQASCRVGQVEFPANGVENFEAETTCVEDESSVKQLREPSAIHLI